MATSNNISYNKAKSSPVDSNPQISPPENTQLSQQLQIADLISQYPNLNIKGILGGKPVAEQNQEYFIVFDEAGETGPEIINHTQFKVIYLCDSLLNTSKPAKGNISNINITQNFEVGKQAIVRSDQGTALNPQLVGSHKIRAVGSIAPIIGSQIGTGRLEYVTTMSFNPEDQLGLPGGTNVVNYVNKLKKSWGYNNIYIASQDAGDLSFLKLNSAGEQAESIGPFSWAITDFENDTNDTELEGTAPEFKVLYDKITQIPTGSGSNPTSGSNRPSFLHPGYVEGDAEYSPYNELYLTELETLTSSLDGNTRVKVSGYVGIRIATSSIKDIHESYLGYQKNQSTGMGGLFWGNLVNSIYGPEYFYDNIELQLIRKDAGGNESILVTNTKPINWWNPSINITTGTTPQVWRDWLRNIDNPEFRWCPRGNGEFNGDGNYLEYYNSLGMSVNDSTWLSVSTGWFDTFQGDRFFLRVVLPEEDLDYTNSPLIHTPIITDQEGEVINFEAGDELLENPDGYRWFEGFTQIIGKVEDTFTNYKDKAAIRTYTIFDGNLEMKQETRAGNLFIPNIHGVTASYFISESDGQGGFEVNPSLYNYTSSYWYGYTNFSSSEEGIGCWLTASQELVNFYGDDYYQLPPGTEDYNELNNETVGGSSLGTGDGKKTWLSYGGNPFRHPFKLKIGDYIRFEYSPDKEYLIIGVQSINNQLKILLNRQLYPSIVLDNFLVYRIIPDGQYIILDVRKDNEAGLTQAFRGIILPQYSSENLQANSDGLIFKLKEAGILQDGANNTLAFE